MLWINGQARTVITIVDSDTYEGMVEPEWVGGTSYFFYVPAGEKPEPVTGLDPRAIYHSTYQPICRNAI